MVLRVPSWQHLQTALKSMTLQPQLKSTLHRHSTELMVVVLLAVLYLPLIIHWYDGWLNKTISLEHEYYSHGVIGLPFAAYIVWEKNGINGKNSLTSLTLLGLCFWAWQQYFTSVALLISLAFPYPSSYQDCALVSKEFLG